MKENEMIFGIRAVMEAIQADKEIDKILIRRELQGDLAKELARLSGVRTMSAQAIGGAVGHNPVSILVPCHRVVGCDGSLTGYAGGLTRKAELLQLEGTDPLRVLERRRAECLIRQD